MLKGYALDKGMRTFDAEGRLHVKASVICMAAVNPYLGNEVPGWQELGLEPNKVYQMFRPPEEIAKGALTSNNIQLLDEHLPVHAGEPQKKNTVGSTGTDAAFDGKCLINSLVIWDANAIADVEAEKKREMSPSYSYTPDMTPGEWEGIKYDGRMTGIAFNHVALVEEGRQGPNVSVADNKLVVPLAGLMERLEEPTGIMDRFVWDAPVTAFKGFALIDKFSRIEE